MAWVLVRVCLFEPLPCAQVTFVNPATNAAVWHVHIQRGELTVMVPPGLTMYITNVPLAMFRGVHVGYQNWLPYLRRSVSADVYATHTGYTRHVARVGNLVHGALTAHMTAVPAQPPVNLWMTCFTAVPTTTTPLHFHSQVIDWVVAFNSQTTAPVQFIGYMVTFVIGSDGLPRPSKADMVAIAQYADTASGHKLQLGAVNGGYNVPWSAACSTSPTSTISCTLQFLGAVNTDLRTTSNTLYTLIGGDYEDDYTAYGIPLDPKPQVMSTLIKSQFLDSGYLADTGVTTVAFAGGVAYNGTNLTAAGVSPGITVMGMPEMYGLTDGDTCQYANTTAGILGNWFPPTYPSCVSNGVCATQGCISNATLFTSLLTPDTPTAATMPLFSLEQFPRGPCYSSVFSDTCATTLQCCFAEADFGTWTVSEFVDFLLQYAAKVQLGRAQTNHGLQGALTLGVFEVGQLPLPWFTQLKLPAPTRT